MNPSYVILTVADPLASAAFYGSILGTPLLEAQETFALLRMNDATLLGLWSSRTIQPPVSVAAGSTELCFTLATRETIDACHETWKAKGLPIVQAPVEADFGYTFTALDPDGHRLRVLAPQPN